MDKSMSVLVWLCIALIQFVQSGELTVAIHEACKANALSDGFHYVSIHSPKLDTFSSNHINSLTIDEITNEQASQSQFEKDKHTSKIVNLVIETSSNNDNNNNNKELETVTEGSVIVYLLYINCLNGDMYFDPKDYYTVFDEVLTPLEGFTVMDVGASTKSGSQSIEESESDPLPEGENPLDSSKTSKTVKWTAQYIVWLVLLIMVGVFALGIFLLLYWWCCHGRTYRLVDTSSFPNTAYTQLQSNADSNVYGSNNAPGAPGSPITTTSINMEGAITGNSNNFAREIYQTPNIIDDTMVSQTITVENDVLP